jgi:hypothetical protein
MERFLSKMTKKRRSTSFGDATVISIGYVTDIFYKEELMRKKSRLIFQRVFGDIESEYGFLNRSHCLARKKIWVAVTTELIAAISELNGKFFVTNYCIKYQANEFRNFRKKVVILD